MFMGLDNPSHIAILVVILLLVFGARRLPEIGRSLGSGIREFKSAVTGESDAPQPPAPLQTPAATQTPSSVHIATAAPAAPAVGNAEGATAASEQPEHVGTPSA